MKFTKRTKNIILYGFIAIILVLIFLLLTSKSKSIESMISLQHIPDSYPVDESNPCPYKGIPKIIHHVAQKDESKWYPTWKECYESWYKWFPEPEYKHMMWHDEDFEPFVRENFPFYFETFKNYPKHIQRVDMIRPMILYKYGGIYADMDYITYQNFYDLLPDDKVSIIESPHKSIEHLQNSLMASPKEHLFWLLVINQAYEIRYHETNIDDKNEKKLMDVLETTGPKLFSKVYDNYSSMVNVLPHEKWYGSDNSDELIAKHFNTAAWM